MTNEVPKAAEPNAQTINFDYVKGSDFRVLHVDGAFAALTTQGGVTISFFSERQPIPRRVVHRVDAEGRIAEESRNSASPGTRSFATLT